jgi:subtilisin family serine protease
MRIAVVDSGWDTSVQESRVDGGVAFVSVGDPWRVSASSDTADVIGHGTLCADLIMQRAPFAHIVPVRIFGSRLEASGAQLIAGISWAVRANVDLINISASSKNELLLEPLARVCREAVRRKIVVVAAASGSSGKGMPAELPEVIGVDVRNHGDSTFQICRDEQVQVVLPRRVYSGRGLRGELATGGGTSFAAAYVSGMIARALHGTIVDVDDRAKWLALVPQLG